VRISRVSAVLHICALPRS